MVQNPFNGIERLCECPDSLEGAGGHGIRSMELKAIVGEGVPAELRGIRSMELKAEHALLHVVLVW